METIGKIWAGIIALEHIYILYLEMFLWTKPTGLKAFGTTQEQADSSKVLAANQGLYNGFLAAGLIWGIFYPDLVISRQIIIFFLSCVVVAGIYGGITVKRSILMIQAVPALIALIVVIV